MGSDSEVAAKLDGIVVEAASADWVKMAVFMAAVVDAAKAAGIEVAGKAVAERIYALVEAGRLEAQGNVRRWRAASIRRKG